MFALLRSRALAVAAAMTVALLPALPVLAAQPEPEIDLRITKVDSKDPVEPEEQFQYIIAGVNDGPSGALEVFVVDTLPDEVAFVAATTSQGVCTHDGSAAGGVVTCNVGALALDGTVDVTITVQVNPGVVGTFINFVRIENRETTPGAPEETDLTNNEDEEPTTVLPPRTGQIGDRVWQDDDGDGVQDPGEPGVPGVTVTLGGDGAGTSQSAGADGFYPRFTSLPPGDFTVTVDLTTAPAGWTLTTPATVAVDLAVGEIFLDADFGLQPPEPTGPDPIDLELVKDVAPTQVSPGQPATFSVTVTNKGPGPATGVVVGDVLPDGLELQSHDGGSAFDPSTLTWTIGDLAVGASASLQFTVTVTRAGSFTNVAQVTAANEPDVDSTPNNNVPEEDDQDDATVVAAGVLATVLGDDVFFDSDQDGVRDPTETGIAGATVTITRLADGATDTATTNADGKYLFTGIAGGQALDPGDYRIEVAVPPLANTGITRATTPISRTVTVPVLQPGEDFENLDNDFGFILALGDLVWFDNDQDGRKDANEQGIPNVELILQDAAGNELGRVRTNSSGIYGFRVPPGTYRVMVNRATLPSSVEFLTFPGANLHTKTLATADDLTADFGYCGGPAILPCTGLTTGGIGGAGAVLVLVGAGLLIVGRRREDDIRQPPVAG